MTLAFFLLLTSFIWAPILIGLIACDRCRAFLGYNILAFGGIFIALYAVHSIIGSY